MFKGLCSNYEHNENHFKYAREQHVTHNEWEKTPPIRADWPWYAALACSIILLVSVAIGGI